MNKEDLRIALSCLCTSLVIDSDDSKAIKKVFDVLYPIWAHMNENNLDSCCLSACYSEKE